jgi:hypothetical protein
MISPVTQYDTQWNVTGVAYYDEWGGQWRPAAGGKWERIIDYIVITPAALSFDGQDVKQAVWAIDDPDHLLDFDPAPYADYVRFYNLKMGQGITDGNYDPRQSANPYLIRAMFSMAYNPIASGSNLNPYASLPNRDALRRMALSVGLTSGDADAAALSVAQDHYRAMNEPYSEAMHPAIVADMIAHRIADKAGVFYPGLTPAQISTLSLEAQSFQDNIKAAREAYENSSDMQTAAWIASIATGPLLVSSLSSIAAGTASTATTLGTAAKVANQFKTIDKDVTGLQNAADPTADLTAKLINNLTGATAPGEISPDENPPPGEVDSPNAKTPVGVLVAFAAIFLVILFGKVLAHG